MPHRYPSPRKATGPPGFKSGSVLSMSLRTLRRANPSCLDVVARRSRRTNWGETGGKVNRKNSARYAILWLT